MDSVQIPQLALNSGYQIPALAFGTGACPVPPPEQLVPLILEAIAAGHRHLDTAAFYDTEESVGRAVAEALRRGLIKSRDELFVTSKLWVTHTHADLVLPALQQTLGNLGLEYVDLYLIHWPVRIKMESAKPITENLTREVFELMNFEMKETWEAMEKCCKMGLAKSIGVSNFSCAKLSKLLQNATIHPAVNQVEMNVGWQQQKLMEYCKEKGIHVSAYSPLGAKGSAWGSNAVMDSPIIKEIATSKNKTVAQVAMRWIFEQGASTIVRSLNKERIMENLKIFDWELTEEDVNKIKQMPQNRANLSQPFVSPDGQYKSQEELWDGEI